LGFNFKQLLSNAIMPANNYILQIPEPCNQDWNRMSDTGTGKFCTHCSKSLIDFTSLTDAEIIQLLQKNQGQLCGRLDATQLNRALINRQQKLQTGNGLKKIMAALLMLITAKDIKAANPPAQKTSFVQWQYNNIPGNKDDNDTTTVTTLTGTVIDSADKEPLISAIVKNLTRQTGVVTDAGGHFSIEAAIGDKIQIMYLGYTAEIFTVTDHQYKAHVLSPAPINMNSRLTGLVAYVNKPTPVLFKPTLKARIRRFFGIKDKT
jgi:hypothetical protein